MHGVRSCVCVRARSWCACVNVPADSTCVKYIFLQIGTRSGGMACSHHPTHLRLHSLSFSQDISIWTRIMEWRDTRGDQVTGAIRSPENIKDDLKVKNRKERYTTPPVFQVGRLVQPDMSSSVPCLKLGFTSAVSGFLFASFGGIPVGFLRSTVLASRGQASATANAFSTSSFVAESVYFGFKAGGIYGTYLGLFRLSNSINEHQLGRKNTKESVATSGSISAAVTAAVWAPAKRRLPLVAIAGASCGGLIFAGATLAGVSEF